MSGLTIGSLFSGIGGLELGLSWGLGDVETLWQVEYEEHARLILAQHWPDAERHQDVRHVGSQNLAPVDLICGGFPCQPHSLAGKRDSSNDERDLWGEFARIIGEVKPRWIVAENVPGVLSSRDPAFSRDHPGGFFLRVLRNLAEMGFDAEWGTFPASAVGALHKRERVFIVAYASGESCGLAASGDRGRRGQPAHTQQSTVVRQADRATGSEGVGAGGSTPAHVADSDSTKRRPQPKARQHEQHGHDGRREEAAGGFAARRPDVDDAQCLGWDTGRDDHACHDGHFTGPAGENAAALAHATGTGSGITGGGAEAGQSESGDRGTVPRDVAYPDGAGREEQHAPAQPGWAGQRTGRSDALGDSTGAGLPNWAGGEMGQPSPLTQFERSGGREVECDFRGMAHGISLRVDRLTRLGNGVVPQQAAVIGRAIAQAEEWRRLTGNLPERIICEEHIWSVA